MIYFFAAMINLQLQKKPVIYRLFSNSEMLVINPCHFLR